MVKDVIVSIQPFDFKQKIYLFENGTNLIMEVSVPLQDLPERVLQICYQNNVENVKLKGLIDYTAKIKEDIREKEISHYGHKTLKIELV
jgi:hypothetical protein